MIQTYYPCIQEDEDVMKEDHHIRGQGYKKISKLAYTS